MDPLRVTHLCCALVVALAPSGAAHASALLDSAPAWPSVAAPAATVVPARTVPAVPPAATPTATCTPAPSGAGVVITFSNAPQGTMVECGPIPCRLGLIAITAFAASGGIEASAEGPCIPSGAPAAVSTAPVPDAQAFALLVVHGAFFCVATALADRTRGTAACGSL